MPPTHKFLALSQLLASLDPTPQKTIIYVSTCAQVDYFQHLLPVLLDQINVAIIPLHGKHQPNVRQKNFGRFVQSATPVLLLTTDVAARGLDVPQVDLVVQLDPPGDSKVFIHRCGRAGRAGRKGLSVVMLQPEEEGYVDFLAVRQTPIVPLRQPAIHVQADDVADRTRAMRDVIRSDRALHDKGQRAFVSWVRAYSKHQARSIFRVDKLDWQALGDAWALLRLPRMPESTRWTGDRSLGVVIDLDNYAYRIPARERARQTSMKEANDDDGTTKTAGSAKPGSARLASRPSWNRNAEDRLERSRRREKKHRRREAQRDAQMTPEQREKHQRLQKLVEEVKRRNVAEESTFEGFDD